MQNVIEALGRLYDDVDTAPADEVVRADLRRGRVALRHRRMRRSAYVAGGAAVAVTVGSLAYTASDGSPKQVAGTGAPTTSDTAVPGDGEITLVAYDGAQRPGFVVKEVPDGYVLQGVSGSVLDVAPSRLHTSLDDFVGKLVVSVDDDVTPQGTPVAVGDRTGHYRRSADGTQDLTYPDGGHLVDVQSWSTIKISRDQLVRFAEGITVTKDVQLSHG